MAMALICHMSRGRLGRGSQAKAPASWPLLLLVQMPTSASEDNINTPPALLWAPGASAPLA